MKKKIITAVIGMVCLMSSVFCMTPAQKTAMKNELQKVSDAELVAMMYAAPATLLQYVAAEKMTLADAKEFKELIEAECKRRTSPSTKDKVKDSVKDKASKASDWFWGQVGVVENKVKDDYNAVRKGN